MRRFFCSFFFFLPLFFLGCEPQDLGKFLEDAVEGFFPDGDGDGVLAGADCDDGDPGVYPGAAEVCNGVDDNCDGAVDEEDRGVANATAWHPDTDADGFGAAGSMPVRECGDEPPIGGPWSLLQSDCNDADPTAYPGAFELCDHVDNNCDGEVDETYPTDRAGVWYPDADGDYYGVDAYAVVVEDYCVDGYDTWGLVPRGGDCDDADGRINPSMHEACDDIDNNCDGAVDEGLDCPSDTGFGG